MTSQSGHGFSLYYKKVMNDMKHQSDEFYNVFVDKYDVMISDRRYKAEIPFFQKIFDEYDIETILDCACGTGWHVIKFSELGFEVTGCDVSNDMIKKALQNATSSGMDVNFLQVDFKHLTEAFDKKFDCVVCWGNSLNHEPEDGIKKALATMFSVLNDNGCLIIEIRNLPKLKKEKTRFIPMHYHKEPNGDVKLFIYVVDYHDDWATFNVISIIETDGKPKFEVNSSDYNIVSAEKLKKLLTEVGFKDLQLYGDVEFNEFSNDRSDGIIIIATKNGDVA